MSLYFTNKAFNLNNTKGIPLIVSSFIRSCYNTRNNLRLIGFHLVFIRGFFPKRFIKDTLNWLPSWWSRRFLNTVEHRIQTNCFTDKYLFNVTDIVPDFHVRIASSHFRLAFAIPSETSVTVTTWSWLRNKYANRDKFHEAVGFILVALPQTSRFWNCAMASKPR